METKINKNYFTENTELAIIRYNSEIDINIKNKIYENEIHYAFFKLTENLIHTYKYYYTDVDNLEDLQFEVIQFLVERMHLFHHSKNIDDRIRKIIVKKSNGVYKNNFIEFTNNAPKVTQNQINEFISTLILDEIPLKNINFVLDEIKKITPPKAYSYFGTIAKRYLIIYNDKNYKKKIESIDIGNLEGDSDLNETSKHVIHDNLLEETDDSFESKDLYNKHDKLSDFIDDFVEYCTQNIYTLFPDKKGVIVQEAKIADAILELFRKRNQIDIFNKKALYIHIRELIDVKTPKITKVAEKLYDIFRKKWVFYLENGYYKF
jgi:hypothetical protein